MQSPLIGLNDKICDAAQDLWEKWLSSGEPSDYQAYLDHVRNCENCFKDERRITL
jgi:hypothetical protein